jgi:hypothetical protein
MECRGQFFKEGYAPNSYLDQGCQIFRGTIIQNGGNITSDHKIGIPMCHKIYVPNGRKIDQMGIKYSSILQCKTLQNLPKLGCLV